MSGIFNKENLVLLGEVVLLASMQFSIGSVEMSSKFSVKNFSKDQETLQNAADALVDYLRIGIIWSIGLSLLFYAKHDTTGLILCLLSNIIIILWIYMSYINAFKHAMKMNNLKFPVVRII
jgi:hypothetical protein